LISAPWHFGLNVGWRAGLYSIPEEKVDYTNENAGTHVVGSRPAIMPPGFFRFGIYLEDEKSIGIATDVNVHYKNYRAIAHIDDLPYPFGALEIDADQEIPYVHVQWAWGIQKSLQAAKGRVLFPLGVQFTNNWLIPAASQDLIEEYINNLTLEDIEILVNDYRMAIDYVKEHRWGMRLNFGLAVAAVQTKGFSWLFGTGLDWNILFGANSNGVAFYPEFNLSTGFRF
jgi:hypothetical protein